MYNRVYIEDSDGRVLQERTRCNDKDLEFYAAQALALVAEEVNRVCLCDDDLSFALKTAACDHRVIADGKTVAHIRSKDVVLLARRILRRDAK